jgi:hypothetical protein
MKHFIVSILLLLSLVSCKTTVPFTGHIKKNCGLDNFQLQHVQFYTSDKIILYKVKQQGKAQVHGGKIILSEIGSSETLIINKNTPCIFVGELNGKILLSFERGEDRNLLFGVSQNDFYSLMAKSWDGDGGVVEYAGNTYQTNNGNVHLKVSVKSLKRMQRKQRYVEGRRLTRN